MNNGNLPLNTHINGNNSGNVKTGSNNKSGGNNANNNGGGNKTSIQLIFLIDHLY